MEDADIAWVGIESTGASIQGNSNPQSFKFNNCAHG